MMRTCSALALTTSLACTVGPAFIGETAESSSAGTQETGDTAQSDGDDDVGETTQDDGATGPGNDSSWPVQLDGRPRKLDIADDGSPRVIFAPAAVHPEIQAFTSAGEPGPRIAIGEGSAGTIFDFARTGSGGALVYTYGGGYDLQALVPDLTEALRVIVDIFEDGGSWLTVHDLAMLADGTHVVVGTAELDDLGPFVHVYDADAWLSFRYEMEFPGYDVHRIAVLDDPDTITVRMQLVDGNGEYVDDHIARFTQDGEIFGDASFVSASIATLPPLPRADGWATIGSSTKNGGVRFEFFDDEFVSTGIMDDPDSAAGDYPIEAIVTPSGFAVLVHVEPVHDVSFEVRTYDEAGVLVGVTEVPVESQGSPVELADLEVAPDGTLFLVTDTALTNDEHAALLHRIAP